MVDLQPKEVPIRGGVSSGNGGEEAVEASG